jgi:hypothetical protein
LKERSIFYAAAYCNMAVPKGGCSIANWSFSKLHKVRHQGAIQIPIPIIASDMTITNTSIVSHVGMRFSGF